MNIKVFSYWILILTIGWLEWFSIMQNHFSGKHFLEIELRQTQALLENQKLQTSIARYQMRDFEQSVAVLVPSTKINGDAYQKRTLASVVAEPDSEKLHIEYAASLFEKGKTAFRDSDYDRSGHVFKELVRVYPNSTHVVESYFLLGESYYQTNDLDNCLDVIDTMVNLFPEHDLTGFALLRMGQIFANRDRIEDAEQVYATILKNFSNKDLKDQAQRLIKEISL